MFTFSVVAWTAVYQPELAHVTMQEVAWQGFNRQDECTS
jgi:hypothetical protein